MTSFAANSLSAKTRTSLSSAQPLREELHHLEVLGYPLIVMGTTSRKALFLPRRYTTAWTSPQLVPLVGFILDSKSSPSGTAVRRGSPLPPSSPSPPSAPPTPSGPPSRPQPPTCSTPSRPSSPRSPACSGSSPGLEEGPQGLLEEKYLREEREY